MSITSDPFGSDSALASPARRRRASVVALLWTGFNALQLAFTLLWTAAWISIALALHALTGRRRLPLRMAARCWAPGLLGGAGARLRVEGMERIDWSRQYVLVCNHQSMIDICALFRATPVPLHFLLKQEMRRVPFVGRYAQAMGMIFIDRGRRSASAFLRQARVLMDQGATLCVFPEGGRGDGPLAPFKGGAFQVAIDAGVTVLPVAVCGAGAVLSRHGVFRVRPGTITVRFGDPLATAGADRDALVAQAHASVQAMLGQPARG